MSTSFVLAISSKVRYATGAMMYFAQGIPYGLLGISIPVWLASEGVSASAIGSYLAVIVLPWAFKLVTGPLMDRFEFPSMGRRRPWVLGAQLGLSLSLLALMLIENPVEQIGLLMLIGVLINCFAATQDVAVDGMAIDLTPIREQGRLNAFMSFGKAIGWALTSAVTGVLLVTYGLAMTAIACSVVAFIAFFVMLLVLEQDGERILPWSKGAAESSRRKGKSFNAVFGDLNKVLWKSASLVVMAIMFFDGLVSGYGQALMPIAAVKLFGFTTPQWSQLVAMMGLIGAVLALGLGPLIDRFGAKRMMFLTAALVGTHAFMLAQTQHMWQDTLYVRVMLSFWIMMLPVVMVCVIALAMAICKSTISATQFAIYMSIANLGHSAGSKIYGMVAEHTTFVQNYLLLGGFVIAMLIVLLMYRHSTVDGDTPGGDRRTSRVTVPIVGGEGGLFISGAMRCPKCLDDMEQIVHKGVEIDRCASCNGIWFDAGEQELLSSPQAAAAIDTGSARIGKTQNKVDDYPCPRCGGGMIKMTDPKQHHIWYEQCSACSGSFYDAGEFRDLSEHTISDFFKGLSTPERG